MATSGTVTSTAKTDGRYYRLEWDCVQSVANNTSTIRWTLYAAGAPSATYWVAERTCYVDIDGERVYSKTAYVERKNGVVTSGSKTLTHSSDGTKSFTISIGAAVYYSTVNSTGSATFTLDTIARASGLSVGNGTLGSAQTITADRKSSSFTHTVTWASGSYSGTIASGSNATSWSFTPGLELANGAPYGTSVYCEVTLTTYSGSTWIGAVTKAIWLAIPDSVKPTCSLTLSDANGYSGTFGGYIQRQSALHVVVNASGAYGSSITSYSVTVNGSTYTSQTFETDVLRNYGSNTASVTVWDTRGRSYSTSTNFDVIAYDRPFIPALSNVRCNSDGTENDLGSYAKVTYSYSITSLSNQNSKSAVLYYKKNSESAWTAVTLTASYSVTNQSTIIPADEASSYNIRLVVGDSFADTTNQIVLSTGYCLYHIPTSGKGITFGGIAEEDGFQIKMDAHFHNGITEDIKVLYYGNCNELLTSGNYYIGNAGTNKPGDGLNGWLTVKSYGDAAYCYQEYVSYQGQRYWRMRNNGTWEAWQAMNISGSSTSVDYATSAGTATSANTANLLSGFASKASAQSWGVQTGSFITGMDDSTGGSIAWRRDCPSAGRMSMVIDGDVYVNEGRDRLVSEQDIQTSDSGYIKIGAHQICWGKLTFSIAVSTATANCFYGIWSGTHNFGRGFASTPSITLTVESTLIKSVSLLAASSSAITKVQLFDTRSRTSQTWTVHYIAVGKAG